MKFIAAALLFAGCVLGSKDRDSISVMNDLVGKNDFEATRLIEQQARKFQIDLQEENMEAYLTAASKKITKCLEEKKENEEEFNCFDVKLTQEEFDEQVEEFKKAEEEFKKAQEELKKEAEAEKARYATFDNELKKIDEKYQQNEIVQKVQELEEEAYELMAKESRKYLTKLYTRLGASEENKEENEEEDVEKRFNEIQEELKELRSEEDYKTAVNNAETAVNKAKLEMAIAEDEYYQNDDKKFENAELFQQRFNKILTEQAEGKIDEESFKNALYDLYEEFKGAEALKELKEFEAKVQEQMKQVQEEMKAVEQEDKETIAEMMEMIQKMFQNTTSEDEKAEEKTEEKPLENQE